MDAFNEFFNAIHWPRLMAASLRIGVVLIAGWVLMAMAKMALSRFETRVLRRGAVEGELPSESAKRAETLVRLVREGVMIMLWLVAALIILRETGIEIGPILASAGIVGLALGFGAQNLVRDVIAGFFMILENQVRVGDVVLVNGTGGLVEVINFRTIVLRDLSGVVHIFPNGSVTTLANMTHAWSAYVLDIGVAYKEDLDRVMDLMRAVGAEMRSDTRFGPLMIEDIEMMGVDKFDESAVILKARVKTKPGKQWDVGREYRRRLKRTFDREGVEIPYPHRSIHFGNSGKPLSVQLSNDEEAASG